MKKYINATTSNGKYIGGKLYDLPDDYWEDEDAHIDRFELQNNCIEDFADYYIIYRPELESYSFSLLGVDDYLYADLTESMAIKEGVDVVSYPDHIEVIAYYGTHEEIAYLYPVSAAKAKELIALIDNSDFSESMTIENEIAQYAWNGARVEDILKSWG